MASASWWPRVAKEDAATSISPRRLTARARRAEPGQPGTERVIRLELKLLADVGLVGFPTWASLVIARISAARPKIADYPFTTLIPHLGMVRLSDDFARSWWRTCPD